MSAAMFIRVRYQLKSSGNVICLVRSGEQEYIVTLTRGKKVHACSCEGFTKWHKQCKHIKFCCERENARYDAQKAASVQVPAPVVVIAPVAVVEKKTASQQASDDRLKVPLNGNRGFRLERVA